MSPLRGGHAVDERDCSGLTIVRDGRIYHDLPFQERAERPEHRFMSLEGHREEDDVSFVRRVGVGPRRGRIETCARCDDMGARRVSRPDEHPRARPAEPPGQSQAETAGPADNRDRAGGVVCHGAGGGPATATE